MPQIESQLQHRLRVMWNLLRWEGELRNRRLQQVFGLQSLQATRLIRLFSEAHPGQVRQDQANGRWLAGADEPVSRQAGPFDEYLAHLASTGAEPAPWLVDARLQFQEPAPRHLRLVAEACRGGTGLKIRYTSRSRPAGTERVIYPRFAVRLGQRWHIRAWCAERGDFRDFSFGRIRAMAAVAEPMPQRAGTDDAWHKEVSLRIGPHSALPAEQSRMVRDEYFGGAVSMRTSTSAALAHYVLMTARVATDPQREKPPGFLLELLNRTEVEPYLFRSPGRPGSP